MKEIVDEAKQIAGIEKMNLYFTDEELLKQDQEHYYELGMAEGIEKNRREVVLNMLKKKFSREDIADCTNLSLEEIKQIESNN